MGGVHVDQTGALPAQGLIGAIIAFARGRGIDQAELSARAGISAEALSRLKKARNCRLVTALDLAKAAGLTEITLVLNETGASVSERSAAAVSARKLSAGRRVPIDARGLIAALTASDPPPEHRAHLFGFFEELPISAVHEVILDEGLDYTHLAALARRLGAEGKTVEWIEEMAGDGVAAAA